MFKNEKKMFEALAEFLLVGMKAHREEGGGRILLDNNTCGGTVMLGPIRLHKGKGSNPKLNISRLTS
jgi:hypothetical protein